MRVLRAYIGPSVGLVAYNHCSQMATQGTRHATPVEQDAAMKGQQQEPDAPVFGDKGAAVKNSTEVVNNAGFLQAIPALSSCTHDVLTEFIRDGATTVRCDAGETLATLTARDQNLYVLISGTAILRATDDVTITLEPGDYFGGNPNRRFNSSSR